MYQTRHPPPLHSPDPVRPPFAAELCHVRPNPWVFGLPGSDLGQGSETVLSAVARALLFQLSAAHQHLRAKTGSLEIILRSCDDGS